MQLIQELALDSFFVDGVGARSEHVLRISWELLRIYCYIQDSLLGSRVWRGEHTTANESQCFTAAGGGCQFLAT